MNTIYCGAYREGSGYANAAIANIIALDKQGVNVCARPIQYSPNKQTPIEIQHLENKHLESCDNLIQHIPPYSMEYIRNGGLNVGVFYAETDNLPLSWVTRLNLMDLNIVPNMQLKEQLLELGSKYCKPLEVIHIPTDISKYKEYKISKYIEHFRREKSFIFYTIGEYVKRKNLSGLLKAYFSEFNQFEPVGLIIKTSVSKLDSEETLKLVYEEISKLKEGMKLVHCPDILVITERLSEDDLMSIHYHSDCFVQPSYAESWSIPAFDAMCFGKYPIVTNEGGYKEYIDSNVGYLIPSRKAMVFGEGNVHSELFTAKSNWFEPDLYILRKQMREVYNNRELLSIAKQNSCDKLVNFSYEKIGLDLVKVLKQHGNKKEERSSQL